MEVYVFEDLKTKRLLREVGERMDEIALAYIDVVIDACERRYPDDATEEEWQEFCNELNNALIGSITNAFMTRGL